MKRTMKHGYIMEVAKQRKANGSYTIQCGVYSYTAKRTPKGAWQVRDALHALCFTSNTLECCMEWVQSES